MNKTGLFVLGLSAVLLGKGLAIKVENITGNLRIQKEGSKKWIKVKRRTRISDNDILKTTFQSTVDLSVNEKNYIFLGANTRLLINLIETKAGSDTAIINLTVFEGAVFVKLKDKNLFCNLFSFSSSGVCRGVCHAGMVVDEQNDKTDVQVFEGEIKVQNIILKGERVYKKGLFAVIASSEEPSSPEPISNDQITILARYYGTEFVDRETEDAGITPVSSVSAAAAARLKGEEAMVVDPEKGKSMEQSLTEERQRRADRQFSMSTVIERLEEFDKKNMVMLKEPGLIDKLGEFNRVVDFKSKMIFSAEHTFLDFYVQPTLRYKNFDISLNLPFVSYLDDGNKKMGLDISGDPAAILDKLNYAQFKAGDHIIYIGGIENLTMGNGLVVNKFSNSYYSDYLEAKGFYFKNNMWLMGFEGVVADLARNDVFMANLYLETDPHYVGLIYAGDLGQNHGYTKGDLAFRNKDDFTPSDLGSVQDVDIYEVDIRAEVINRPPLKFIFYLSFAQMLSDYHNIGYGLTVPGILFSYKNWELLFEGLVTSGKFIPRYFDEFYMENRARVMEDTGSGETSVVPLEDLLFNNNNAKGIMIGGRYNIWRDLTASAVWQGNLFGLSTQRKTKSLYYTAQQDIERLSTNGDMGIDIGLRMGEEVFSRLNLFSFYFRKSHGDYLPVPNDPFEASANTIVGGDLELKITSTLMAGLALKRYFVDTDGSGYIEDAGEALTEIEVGVRKGF
jgi:hypothetical protein